MLVSAESLTSIMNTLQMGLIVWTYPFEWLHFTDPDILTCFDIYIDKATLGALLIWVYVLECLLLLLFLRLSCHFFPGDFWTFKKHLVALRHTQFNTHHVHFLSRPGLLHLITHCEQSHLHLLIISFWRLFDPHIHLGLLSCEWCFDVQFGVRFDDFDRQRALSSQISDPRLLMLHEWTNLILAQVEKRVFIVIHRF